LMNSPCSFSAATSSAMNASLSSDTVPSLGHQP
jgi:hypothetical protein